MYCTRKITDDTTYVGASERRLALFENTFPLGDGVSYNSYLITDEKTVLLDTVDPAVSHIFFENIEHTLAGRALDYVIVNHMEPDHCGTLYDLSLRYPDIKIITNAKAATMIGQFFGDGLKSKVTVVKEGDTVDFGRHTLSFVMTPMVHWPESMMTYDAYDKILYSADAFGAFRALNGNIFADEVNYERDYLDEARRYYTNIVGKYGVQVQAALKKAASLDIKTICPLHGHIWRENLGYIIDKYNTWSLYKSEENSVMIAYASIYGHTENAANILAVKLAERGINNITMYDVSKTHPSYILSDAFKCSHIVLASSTYNAGVFTTMETLLADLKAHNLQNKKVAVIENGTWACSAGKQIKEFLASMKNIEILETEAKLVSAVSGESLTQIESIADEIAKDFEV